MARKLEETIFWVLCWEVEMLAFTEDHNADNVLKTWCVSVIRNLHLRGLKHGAQKLYLDINLPQ